MFPIGDDNTGRTLTPYVTWLLIGLNVLVFFFFQGMGTNAEFTYALATVPAEILRGEDLVTSDRIVRDPLSGNPLRVPGLQPTPVPVYLTLLTAIFMHGSLLHLFGNMLYLWIFGDNVESRMGHGRYLVFYLLGGLLASLAHVVATAAFGGNPMIPSLGASGAISAVLGGYIVLFPHQRVRVIVLRMLTSMPAYMAIGLWFLFQLISGIGMLGAGAQEGGVAYAAHIGGFVAGLVLVKVFVAGRLGPTTGVA
ncbi:MAG: rhomboid family intramembrane serine protease [Acidobacteria bacterium]|nr:rhomboid family intramembrane serine protease [Acidobacteriota bacterium]